MGSSTLTICFECILVVFMDRVNPNIGFILAGDNGAGKIVET
jgi:hypothetical protein